MCEKCENDTKDIDAMHEIMREMQDVCEDRDINMLAIFDKNDHAVFALNGHEHQLSEALVALMKRDNTIKKLIQATGLLSLISETGDMDVVQSEDFEKEFEQLLESLHEKLGKKEK